MARQIQVNDGPDANPFAGCRTVVHSFGMVSEIFKASRFTRGNFLFPTYIEVTDQSVIRHKRSWFSHDEMSITINKVASVHIKTGVIWSEILIESTGGSDPVTSHGHTKADARRIRELIEAAQGNLGTPTGGGGKLNPP